MNTVRFTIYCHTHVASGRKYVGQTETTIEKRWNAHLTAARRSDNGHSCRFFYNAIRKYGAEAFFHEVLEIIEVPLQVPWETMSTEHRNAARFSTNEAEGLWIVRLDCRAPKGFNLKSGGNAGSHHPSTIQRMRDSFTPEKKELIAQANRKRWARPGQREARSEMSRQAWASMTPEERSTEWRRRRASESPEQRSQTRRDIWATKSPDERSRIARNSNAKRFPETRARVIANLKASQNSEQRRANGKKSWVGMTLEERSARIRQMNSKISPERKSEISRVINANMTPEQHAYRKLRTSESVREWQAGHRLEVIDHARKGGLAMQAKLTPQERSERSRKSWVSRKRKIFQAKAHTWFARKVAA